MRNYFSFKNINGYKRRQDVRAKANNLLPDMSKAFQEYKKTMREIMLLEEEIELFKNIEQFEDKLKGEVKLKLGSCTVMTDLSHVDCDFHITKPYLYYCSSDRQFYFLNKDYKPNELKKTWYRIGSIDKDKNITIHTLQLKDVSKSIVAYLKKELKDFEVDLKHDVNVLVNAMDCLKQELAA